MSPPDLGLSMPVPTSATVPPFPAFPAARRYVELGSTGEALSRTFRAIATREAVSLIIGPPGLGKSLLVDLIADGHQDSHNVVVLNQAPVQSRVALIQHLLHGLGVKPDPASDLHLQLVDRVCGEDDSEGLLIVVDEAQSLCTEVLEAIRMVTNISHRGTRRVMAVLCGGNKMDDRLADPSMEALVQRVATRCYLHPLDEGQTRTYVRRTISDCGSDPDRTVNDKAIAAVHFASGGVPRLINQLMTEAIDVAAGADRGMIDADLINVAWANLQQLPSPIVDEPSLAPQMGGLPVEFGSLSGDDELSILEDEPQPAAEIVAPSADELFGSFDDEQSVDVGTSPIRRKTASTSAKVDLQVSLEDELHAEIQEISDSIHGDDDWATIQVEATDDAELAMENEGSPHLAGDDRDMLVVEDSIEMSIETEHDGSMYHSHNESGIDFQAMMARMRSAQ